MPNQRVYELADELGFNRQELVTKINELALGFSVNNYMTKLSTDEIDALREALADDGASAPAEPAQADDDEAVEAAAAEEEVAAPVIRRRKKVTPSGIEPAEEPSDDEEEAGETAVAPTVRKRRKVASAPAEDEAEEAAEAAEAPAEVEEPAAPAADEVEAPADVEPVVVEPAAEAADAVEEPEAAEEAEAVAEAPAEEAEEAAAEEAPAEAGEEAEEAEVEEAEEAPVAEEVAEAPKTPEADEPKAARAPDAPRGKPSQKKEKGGAKVLGQIDSNVVLDRLQAEGKDFSPGPSKRRKSSSGRKRKSRGANRRVVEGRDLYGSKSRRRNRRSRTNRSRPQKTQITEAAEHKKVIRIEDVISVGDLAHQMGVKAGEVAMKLVEMGMMATVNTLLDFETAQLVADEFGYTVENVAFDISSFYDTSPDPEETLVKRAPVVTVMGHVDHGKTSLLDAIRTSDVLAGEAGGITQHIGAYQVDFENGQKITFLDTPGHEAFTELRARGAKATDIVVLVVAADDGVMPQTVEAINHSRDAGVPIIVAINKCDKPTANPERIRQALTEYELIPEEWGGKTLFVEVSALEHINIDELLESITLQAEIEELKANPDRDAQGLVIEAELDVGRGPVATVLVQRGTLQAGDIIVSGQHYGRVRTMYDDRGRDVETAGPSVPVEITGLGGIPEAGEPFFVVPEERDAKRITEHVAQRRRREVMASRAKEVTGSLEDLSRMIQQGEMKELKVIIKGDVQGSVEALREAFSKVGNEEVRVKVIHSGVGGITENDVNLAASSEQGAVIIGFNVRPDGRAGEVAEKYGVRILTHNVIYDAIDQIRDILEGLLSPIVEERVLGRAEVRETFSTPKVGTVAGCYVQDGIIRRNANARLIRDGRVVYESTIASLRRFKDDVTEVKDGFECGLSIANYNDVKVGDVVEVFEHQEVAATL